LERAEDAAFALTDDDRIAWNNAPVARLAAGGTFLKPRVAPLDSDLFISGERERVRDRAAAWLAEEIDRVFPMLGIIQAAGLEGAARGLAFQLVERLAPIERASVEPLVATLKPEDRKRLAQLGIVIGGAYVFLKGLAKPEPLRLLRALWGAGQDRADPLPLPPPGRVSIAATPGIDPGYFTAIGYPAVGPRAIRVDMLDRLIGRLTRATVKGTMPPDSTIAPVLGCSREEADQVLLALGWGRHEAEGQVTYRRRRPPGQKPLTRRRPALGEGEQSPFAVLKQLRAAE
jgi:ATP-dependent RNA helicase SUPV3L1/SUV3